MARAALRLRTISLLDTVTATIANGEALSLAVDLGGLRLHGIGVPATITGSALTFQVSHDGGTTWKNLYDRYGNEITVQVSANRCVDVDPSYFAAINMIKVRSGTSGTPVNQGQETTLQLNLRAI